MATSEGIPSSIDIEFLELNDNPYLEVDSNVYQVRRDSCATDKSGTLVSMTNVPCPCRRTLRQIGRSRHVCHIQYA